ncbi:MAG: hypothetical protein JWL95_3261 [Gemmatimonadetes bacterium]|nr:hypothetical protein [Gemmatimonadota bacterium]
MLFYCVWAGARSVVLDADDQEDADERAAAWSAQTGGGPADSVTEWPAETPFIAEAYDGIENDNDHSLMLLEPSDETAKVMAELEYAGDEDDEDEEGDTCVAEADGPNGEVVRCKLEPHDEHTKHRNGKLVW